jgi:hypothetical protein
MGTPNQGFLPRVIGDNAGGSKPTRAQILPVIPPSIGNASEALRLIVDRSDMFCRSIAAPRQNAAAPFLSMRTRFRTENRCPLFLKTLLFLRVFGRKTGAHFS